MQASLDKVCVVFLWRKVYAITAVDHSRVCACVFQCVRHASLSTNINPVAYSIFLLSPQPFRTRVTTAGQGTNAQFGPNQHMIVRWASSHNNTFSLAVVSAGSEKEEKKKHLMLYRLWIQSTLK